MEDKMKLEEEIGQKEFKSDIQKMLINILYTSNWLQYQLADNLKGYGLTLQQFNILRILRGQHPNPARILLLQERMLDKMSNASRLVERLRKKGFVIRKICRNDRRAVDVKITDSGLALLKELDSMENEWQQRFKKLDNKDINKLNIILDNLRN
jgi:DNA-binding MarR family transcriptional regulator